VLGVDTQYLFWKEKEMIFDDYDAYESQREDLAAKVAAQRLAARHRVHDYRDPEYDDSDYEDDDE
jgi:hypothetical protein